MRAVISAIFYVLCTSCPWHWLPHEYPPKGTVYYYFRRWRLDGTWHQIHQHLRDWLRAIYDRAPNLRAGIIDSQSVKTATMVNKEVGFDANKQIKGRKRFTLVNTPSLWIAVSIVAASRQEREGAKQLLKKVKEEKHPRLIRIFADGGFSGVDFMSKLNSFSIFSAIIPHFYLALFFDILCSSNFCKSIVFNLFSILKLATFSPLLSFTNAEILFPVVFNKKHLPRFLSNKTSVSDICRIKLLSFS